MSVKEHTRVVLKILKGSLIFLVVVASLLNIYDSRQELRLTLSNLTLYGAGDKSDNQYWADKILKGGYILYFRHAERDKYLDVQVYDLLESNFLPKAAIGYRIGEKEYFAPAVCLNDRGRIQSRAIGEIFTDLKLPVSEVIVSPSCRARQTASIAFGFISKISPVLVHRGGYKETLAEHEVGVKNLLEGLTTKSGKSIVVIAHNDVITPKVFSNRPPAESLRLEEGGFAVISKNMNGTVKLEHIFTNFNTFSSQHYKRFLD